MATPAAVHIGTSGWHYVHWDGPFYPRGLSSDRYLAYYAERFATVEINNTFYRLPSRKAVESWRDAVPDGFVFAVKASRFITHMKKLKDPATSTAQFFDLIPAFGAKLGPILFQLPPRWRADPVRLEAFLEALPQGHRYAFEFRDESWFTKVVYETLSRHGAAFCGYDLAGRRSPLELTADFAYLRLHGPGEAYSGRYSRSSLAAWARRIDGWRATGIAVFCYFDNDEKGYAVENAAQLIALLESA